MKNLDIRRSLWCTGILTCWVFVPAARAAEPPPGAPPSESDALYTMGLNIGQQLHQSGVTSDVPIKRVEQGIRDGLAGKRVLAADQMRLTAFLHDSAEAAAVRNAAAAREFLARHGKEPGVTTTSSGLQYKILSEGAADGHAPQPGDQVTVSFRGTLLDGSEFDSSSKPGTASSVQVNGVMKAWTEALQLMKPGARWQLWVPPDLGFGAVSRSGVPGGSLLIYDLQLLSVAPALSAAGK